MWEWQHITGIAGAKSALTLGSTIILLHGLKKKNKFEMGTFLKWGLMYRVRSVSIWECVQWIGTHYIVAQLCVKYAPASMAFRQPLSFKAFFRLTYCGFSLPSGFTRLFFEVVAHLNGFFVIYLVPRRIKSRWWIHIAAHHRHRLSQSPWLQVGGDHVTLSGPTWHQGSIASSCFVRRSYRRGSRWILGQNGESG